MCSLISYVGRYMLVSGKYTITNHLISILIRGSYISISNSMVGCSIILELIVQVMQVGK